MKSEAQKEYIIARYLVELSCSGDETEEQKDTMAQTTPNPEQAHDIINLVRRLDSNE